MSRSAQARTVTEGLKKLTSGQSHLSFNEARLTVAIERAVARIEAHPKLSKHVVFKGGFVLLKMAESERFTRDLDALVQKLSKKEIPTLLTTALSQDLEDGFWFGDYKIKDLADQGEYGGIRVDSAFQLGNPPTNPEKLKKLSRVHIDIGIGDKLAEDPAKTKMRPAIFGNQVISWKVYPLESIFAEKLQTIVDRGAANSRAKDIYDLVLIHPKCTNESKLRNAIELTFTTRETSIPKSFLELAKSLDHTLLRRSWGSVQLSSSQDFESTWKDFLKVCRAIDQSIL